MHFAWLLLLTATAASTATAQITPPIPDKKCPRGFISAFVADSFLYDVPVAGFIDETKSFFDLQWYGGTNITSTTGKDNAVGSTRTFTFLKSKGTERLNAYEHTANSLFMAYSLAAPSLLTGPLPQFPREQIRLESYDEWFSFNSVCGGTATYAQFASVACADRPASLPDVWGQARAQSMALLAVKLGARSFRGNCPVSDERFFNQASLVSDD